MGRRAKESLDELADLLSAEEWLEDQDVEDTLDLDEKFEDFKPSTLTLTEWINAYADAIVDGGFVWDEVTRLIVRAIEDSIDERGGRLALALAPRSGKTTIAQLTVSWAMATRNWSIIWMASSGINAQANTKAVMAVLQRAGYKLHPRISSVKECALAVKAPGILSSLSFGSSTLGRTGHLVICDDLVGKREWIFQEAYQDKLKSTYENDLLSRLTKDRKGKGQVLIAIAQRLGPGDHLDLIKAKSEEAARSGYLDSWRVVEVPYIHYAKGEELGVQGRYPDHWRKYYLSAEGRWGEPTSVRVIKEEVEQKIHEVGTAEFRAMYMCLVDDEGDGRWSSSWIRPVPRKSIAQGTTVLAVDPALLAGKGRDGHGLAVGTIIPSGQHAGKLAILHAETEDCPPHELYERIRDLAIEYRCAYIHIEATASGPELIRQCRKADLVHWGANVVPFRPGGRSKQIRLASCTGLLSTGQVLYPEFAPWIHTINSQAAAVAKGQSHKHDDQVDAVLILLEALSGYARSGMTMTEASWGRGAAFTPKYPGQAIWSRGGSGGSSGEGKFQTDASKEFPVGALTPW